MTGLAHRPVLRASFPAALVSEHITRLMVDLGLLARRSVSCSSPPHRPRLQGEHSRPDGSAEFSSCGRHPRRGLNKAALGEVPCRPARGAFFNVFPEHTARSRRVGGGRRSGLLNDVWAWPALSGVPRSAPAWRALCGFFSYAQLSRKRTSGTAARKRMRAPVFRVVRAA